MVERVERGVEVERFRGVRVGVGDADPGGRWGWNRSPLGSRSRGTSPRARANRLSRIG